MANSLRRDLLFATKREIVCSALLKHTDTRPKPVLMDVVLTDMRHLQTRKPDSMKVVTLIGYGYR